MLPTFADENLLFGDATAERTVQRYLALGAEEVVVKLAAHGCLVAAAAQCEYLPPPSAVTAVDTSGAGDAFNAAYLAARLAGRSASEAGRAGNTLAGEVVRYPGAVLPLERIAALRP